MSSQLVELKKNSKLNHWYEDVKAQKQSGLTVDEWCEQRGTNRHTYYYRYKVVMRAIEDRLANEQVKGVRFAALPEPVPESRKDAATIRLRLGELEVVIPSGASRENILAVIEALKC